MKRIVHILLLTTLLLLGTSPARGQGRTPPYPESLKGVEVYRNLPYAPNGHSRQKLDLYVPEFGKGPFPLIVWIHGGAWREGSKERCLPLPWSKKGYAVASINYRLSSDARFPAQIMDCKTAIRWLRTHAERYRIDAQRVLAWGGSAGGHLASLVGTAGHMAEWEEEYWPGSSQVQAVIDWYGRADLTPVATDPSWANSPSSQLLGGWGQGVAQRARKASPLWHVSKDDPPFLIMHGEKDNVVPLRQSLTFAEALRATGVKVKMVILRGAGHGGPEFLQREQVQIIDTFLIQHLNPEKTASSP